MSFFDPEPDDPGGRSPGSVPQDDGDGSSTDSTNVFEPEPNDPAGSSPGSVPQNDEDEDDSSRSTGGDGKSGGGQGFDMDEEGGAAPAPSDEGAPSPSGGSGGGRDGSIDVINDSPTESAGPTPQRAGSPMNQKESAPKPTPTTAEDRAMRKLDARTKSNLTGEDVKTTRENGTVEATLTQEAIAQERAARGAGAGETPAPTPQRPGSPVAPTAIDRQFAGIGDFDAARKNQAASQLESQLEEQTGADLERGEDFTVQRTGDGEFRAELTESGQQKAGVQDESFGDIPITNPATGNRLEEDFRRISREYEQTFSQAAEESDVVNAVAAPERAAIEVLERTGQTERAETLRTIGGDDPNEGPIEETAEGTYRGIAGVANPGRLALGVKEAGEFVYSEKGLGRAVQGENDLSTLGPQSTDFDAPTAEEQEEQEEFKQDVETRTAAIASTTVESAKEDPAGFTGETVGGLAAGAAAGTAVGRRIPGVSGSDLTGKAIQKTSAGAKRAGVGAKKLLDEDRAQAQVPRGRDKIDIDDEGFGSPDIDPEEQIEQKKQLRSIERDRRQRAEEERTAPGGDESDEPFTASTGDFRTVSGQQNVRAASRNPTARSRSGPTAQQRSTWRGDTSDESPTKSGELIDEEGNVRDVDTETGTKSAADSATTAASQADAAVAGSLSGAMAASQAQSEQAAGSMGRTDTRSDVGTRSQSQTDLDSLSDVEVRVDSRSDTRTDTRSDTDTRIDIDTRSDVDSRVDARVDTRADTRADLEFRNDLDIDLRSAEESDSRRRRRGAFSREFTNPVTDPGELDEALDFGGDL